MNLSQTQTFAGLRGPQSVNAQNLRAAAIINQNRSPRSNSRKNTAPATSGSISSALKGTSFFAPQQSNGNITQHNHGFHQSNSLPVNSSDQSILNFYSANSQISQGISIANYSSLERNVNSSNNLNSNQTKEQFRLLCRRHDKPIEKICTKIGCEQQTVLCSECYFDSQQHIGMHKEHIFNYEDFIAVCKSFSLKFRDDYAQGNKPLSHLLSKLDRQVLKYKNHVKKEEEKIDADFDALIQTFTKDMEDLKSRLKEQLNQHFEKFQEMAKSLKIKASDLQIEKQSNLDNTNDFDDFLKNVKEISASKAQSQNYNFKKLVQNISPLFTRYKEQISKLLANQGNQNSLVINTEQSETLSCFTGLTGMSYLTLNLASQPHLAPIKDLFSDFKELTKNKPLYKNKGEGQKLYQEASEEIKRLYHDLSDNINLFLQSPKSKLALDFNKENFEALTIPEKPEIDDLQFIHKSDYISLKDNQNLANIDFIKNVNTNHSAGIFSLVVIDDDTYVTGSADRTVKVFSMKDHRFLKEVRFSSDITALSTLKRFDGSIMVLVGLYGGFAVLNQGFDIMKMMEGEHESSVNCLVGLKDQETVITASSDPKIVVWNVFNGEILNRKYFDHKDTIYALELFPCGKYLASGGRDKTIKIWKLIYYKETYRNGSLEKMVLDTNIPDSHSTDVTSLKATKVCQNILLSGSANGEVKIWELHDASCVKVIKNSSGWVYKFIVFEREQDPEIDKMIENQENVISHYAYVAPSIQKNSQATKKISNSSFGNLQVNKSNTVSQRMLSPYKFNNLTPSSLMSPSQKKLKNKKYSEQLKKIQFLTASFDGTLKLWNANSDVPVAAQKSKHSFDCFPFGALTAFQKENETKIHILTTGNKNDTTINIWNIS